MSRILVKTAGVVHYLRRSSAPQKKYVVSTFAGSERLRTSQALIHALTACTLHAKNERAGPISQ